MLTLSHILFLFRYSVVHDRCDRPPGQALDVPYLSVRKARRPTTSGMSSVRIDLLEENLYGGLISSPFSVRSLDLIRNAEFSGRKAT